MKIAMTGAATGIGAETAARLKARGHHVTAFDITEPAKNVDRFIQVDMSDPASIDAALAEADGPYDALINNAGIPPRDGLAELVLKINFIGLRTFLNGMLGKLAPGASIVNTASRAGSMWRDNLHEVKALLALDGFDAVAGFVQKQGIDATRAYNLSKEAVIVMTMAETHGMLNRGFRMNSVSPAAVSTGIFDDFMKAFGPKVAQNLARVGRAGEADRLDTLTALLQTPD